MESVVFNSFPKIAELIILRIMSISQTLAPLNLMPTTRLLLSNNACKFISCMSMMTELSAHKADVWDLIC